MSYITIGMIALTAIALIFGTLWGMGRGRNRSILRLILIIVCVLGAIFLRQTVTDIIMGIDTGDGTVAEMLSSSLSQGGDEMPASMQKLVVALIEIIFGLVSYFLVFFALRIVTWILVFPICKIFVKREVVKKKGWGALLGLIQGIVIAFAVLVPLNGLAVQVGTLSKIEMDGKPMIEVPAEVGLEEYAQSAPCKVYGTIGDWYFEMLTTAKTQEGEEITLKGTCSVLTSMLDVGNSIGKIEPAIQTLNNGTATDQEKFDALNDAGQGLTEVAQKISALDEGSRALLNDILLETLSSEDLKISLDYINFDSMADFFSGMANYVNKAKIENAIVSQEEVDELVNGFAGSEMLVDMFIGDGTGTVGKLYQVETQDYLKFASAINNNTELSLAQKAALLTVFCISI